MKRIIKLIMILGLLVQAGNAQTCDSTAVKTEEEYRLLFNDMASRVQLVRKDSINYINKPFSEFVALLKKSGFKAILASPIDDNNQPRFAKTMSISFWFMTQKDWNFMGNRNLRSPAISVYFEEKSRKPYEKALDLWREHNGYLTKEIEEYHSDAIIRYIRFVIPDDIYLP